MSTEAPQHAGTPAQEIDPTRVVGRRVLQYAMDVVVVALVAFSVVAAFSALGRPLMDGSSATVGSAAVGILGILLALAFLVWYWVIRPASHDGQTFGMQLMNLRVVHDDGTPATRKDMLIRWLMLLIDAQVSFLVGLVAMLASARHQRLGDMVAHTVVVDARQIPAV